MRQAITTGLNGETLYRWYVDVEGKSRPFVTWAADEDAVRLRFRRHPIRQIRAAPGLGVGIGGETK